MKLKRHENLGDGVGNFQDCGYAKKEEESVKKGGGYNPSRTKQAVKGGGGL